MSSRVVILDYGLGNLLSVKRALENRGADVEVTDDPQVILVANSLVIPGVGAFADGISELNKRHLVEPIQRYAASGRPLLGICLGMQLLFSESEEFGMHRGLDLISGRVLAIPNQTVNGKWRKTPHIGWNEIRLPPARRTWESTPFAGLAEGAATYFLHSFAAVPADTSVRLANSDHEGFPIAAAVLQGNILGCQFHPEKSGETGLTIIDNFLSM